MQSPVVGDRVLFMSGRLLGHVGVVDSGRIQVSAGDKDVWLSIEAVYLTQPGVVRLVCEARGLCDYAVRAPDGRDGTGPAI
jgi:hypothetical protein